MDELTTVSYEYDQNNHPGILGTQLHQALGILTDYRHWFPRMSERLELQEGRDFTTLVKNVRRRDGVQMPGKKIDHLLTISAAKEICLVQSSPMSRMLRRQLVNAEQTMKRAAIANEKEIVHYQELLQKSNEQNMQLSTRLAMQNEELAIRGIRIAQQNSVLQKQQEVIQQQKKAVKRMKPKVDYCDRVLNSKDVLPVTAIAKTYDWSGQKLNAFLKEKGIQYKCNGGWVLYARYAGKGYVKYITYIRKYDGLERTRIVMKWTQKGRLLIDQKMREAGWMPKEEEDA